MEQATRITQLLEHAANGDDGASDELFEVIYPMLRKLAHNQLEQHRRETLCTTDLVNEASLRLLGPAQLAKLSHRGHLYATAAKVMRHVLIDYARRRGAAKRGGEWQRVSLDGNALATQALSNQVLALDSALTRLNDVDTRGHDVVELKFFGGCSLEEIATHLNISDTTVKRDWRKARAFLHAVLADEA